MAENGINASSVPDNFSLCPICGQRIGNMQVHECRTTGIWPTTPPLTPPPWSPLTPPISPSTPNIQPLQPFRPTTAPPVGWICPKCGGVSAPFVPTCYNCAPNKPLKIG